MVETVGRVFVAVPLPEEVRMAVADQLAKVEMPGRVASPGNWHITLRFLGSLDEVTYQRFLAALDQTELGDPFRARLGRLGAFPRPGNATVIWLEVTKGLERLEELAANSEKAAQTAGLGPEERPFRAHLTLSRVRPSQDVGALIAVFPETGIEWHCGSIVVYRSHLGRGGASYEVLETLPLF